VDRDDITVEEDLTFIERVNAADALDQRRLAGAVIAEKGQYLAAIRIETDILEGMDRAKALLRMTDGKNRGGRGGPVH
jgi:hypothetical protein